MKHLSSYTSFITEKKPAGAPDWHDSDAPDAEGRFKDLSPKDLAAWLIKTRKGDVKRISGSLTQQVVFNRNEDPEYAEKMEKTRKEVYKQLDRQDLLDAMDEGKKPGPDAYMTGLDDETEEDKEEQMKKQAEMDDDDPEAYKELPGDEEAREKGKVKTSKHVKSYHELYGDETDEALSDYEEEDADYDKLYKKYKYFKKNRKEKKVDEAKDNDNGVAKGDRSPIKDDAIETGLKNKAKETGVPIGMLRVIMKRGMAAWKTGHRPGATQQQWGYARVNSFLTKQPGTWGGADKDVAKEVRDGGHDKKLKKA